MNMAQPSQGAEAALSLDDVRIIDCDSHFTEPTDLWSSRVPASMLDRVPVQQSVNGVTAWFVDGEPWASTGGNVLQTGFRKVQGEVTMQPFELVDPSAWSVPERLEYLDAAGIWAQVIYPNGVGFSSNHIFAIEDLAVRTLVLQTYNDFFVDIQHESGGRLLPQALLPVWDMDLTVREMTRMLDKGITGFTVSDKPELLGLPELPEPYFEPMWDLMNESGAVTNFHVGSGFRREELEKKRLHGLLASMGKQTGGDQAAPAAAEPFWLSFGPQRRRAVGALQLFMSNLRIISNLCMSNLFDRYPNVKIVSAESGIGWVPFLLESLEFQLEEMVVDPDEIVLQRRRPTEYFRDHLYVMFWFESVGPRKLIEDIGVGNVLVETDFPHPACLHPGARQHFEEVLADYAPSVQRRVLQDNAVELYRISLPVAAVAP
jgi:predicted TIM-barrel fold metal-dependent hydrolase